MVKYKGMWEELSPSAVTGWVCEFECVEKKPDPSNFARFLLRSKFPSM